MATTSHFLYYGFNLIIKITIYTHVQFCFSADSPRQHPWCSLVNKMILDIPGEAEGLIVNLMKYLKKHQQFSKQVQ